MSCQVTFFGTGKNRYQMEIPENVKVSNDFELSSKKKVGMAADCTIWSFEWAMGSEVVVECELFYWSLTMEIWSEGEVWMFHTQLSVMFSLLVLLLVC